jgi:hypothetical protein
MTMQTYYAHKESLHLSVQLCVSKVEWYVQSAEWLVFSVNS